MKLMKRPEFDGGHDTKLIWSKHYRCVNIFVMKFMMKFYVLCYRFGKLRFVKLKDLLSADLPLLPSEFEALVKTHCWEAHEELRKR